MSASSKETPVSSAPRFVSIIAYPVAVPPKVKTFFLSRKNNKTLKYVVPIKIAVC